MALNDYLLIGINFLFIFIFHTVKGKEKDSKVNLGLTPGTKSGMLSLENEGTLRMHPVNKTGVSLKLWKLRTASQAIYTQCPASLVSEEFSIHAKARKTALQVASHLLG